MHQAGLRKKAEQGDAAAQYYLAVAYERGYGVPQDYQEAMKWFRMAAEQGHAKAQCRLGEMHYDSQGVPQDYIQAHMWFNLAAAGNDAAISASAAKSRDFVAKEMTLAQIAEAQKLASEWKLKKSDGK